MESAGEGNFKFRSSDGNIQGDRMEGHDKGDKGVNSRVSNRGEDASYVFM